MRTFGGTVATIALVAMATLTAGCGDNTPPTVGEVVCKSWTWDPAATGEDNEARLTATATKIAKKAATEAAVPGSTMGYTTDDVIAAAQETCGSKFDDYNQFTADRERSWDPHANDANPAGSCTRLRAQLKKEKKSPGDYLAALKQTLSVTNRQNCPRVYDTANALANPPSPQVTNKPEPAPETSGGGNDPVLGECTALKDELNKQYDNGEISSDEYFSQLDSIVGQCLEDEYYNNPDN